MAEASTTPSSRPAPRRFRWKWRYLVILILLGLYVRAFIINEQYTLALTMYVAGRVFEIVFYMAIMLVQFVAIFWFLGRAQVYWLQPGETGITFDDYKGNDEVLQVASRIVTLLKGVKGFKEMGGEVSRGLLLVGPPGTGKSYLAQAIATEVGLPFGYASAPSFQSMFMGMGNLKVMNLYRKARKLAVEHGACIVFIDEIDAIGGSRGGALNASSQAMGGLLGGGVGLLNELLLQLDPPNVERRRWVRFLRQFGFRPKPKKQPVVFTIGATNLAEALDKALLRPGRFDRQIVVDPPDHDGRKDVIEYYLSKVKHSPLINIDRVAVDMIGYTPVKVKHVINEAVVKAHFDDRNAITYEDLCYAREVHEWGLKQPISSMTKEERRRLAYHEAGHAVAQLRLLPDQRVYKTTIVRHGSALGLSATKPLTERYTETQSEVLADIQVALAARAAEEIFLETRLSGATGDLASATRLAAAYIGAWGMDKGLYSYHSLGAAPHDGEMRKRINELLEHQKAQVKELLRREARLVHGIAETLLAKDEITGDEIEEMDLRIRENEAAAVSDTESNGHAGTTTDHDAASAPLVPFEEATSSEETRDDAGEGLDGSGTNK